MAYISLIERHGIEKGIEQGMQQGIQKGRQEGMQQGIQKGRQEGMQQGIQKGRQEGLGKGRQQTLLKQLQLKFQRVDESVQRRVEAATDAELELWIERILFADSLEALFTDAEQH